MTTIYVVTDGSYSAYYICGIYSDRSKAEEAKLVLNAYNDIEEYELDVMPDHPPGLLAWVVHMQKDGSVTSVRRTNKPGYEWRPWSSFNSKTTTIRGVIFDMWAADEQHAIKIANERRIALLASGQWNEDWNSWSANLATASPPASAAEQA